MVEKNWQAKQKRLFNMSTRKRGRVALSFQNLTTLRRSLSKRARTRKKNPYVTPNILYTGNAA